ncbi:MAG TPA: bifunctional histidinol-phosphatase/imidazoleglycerol-phosphate dehydratase HisB [Luteibaculaceae bacterium]|nr:bifunctional histidinol-phosphatase/imidazoleglycerol-phosphate dehydratase HisB [Luteibaculaceae bacterium]
MKKILFIDQDGTLIEEPQENYQLDSWNKLALLPGLITQLRKLVSLQEYDLVLVTNQDGLGTEVFPEEPFLSIHQFLLKTLQGEGISFKEVCIDRSFPHENSPNRKPQVGMLTHYIDNPNYNLQDSYVIGDRPTDCMLAKNLGAKGIFLDSGKGYRLTPEDETMLQESGCVFRASNWEQITDFILSENRAVEIKRITKETDVYIKLNPDGSGKSEISTGLHFFDHMLEQLSRHGNLDLTIKVKGDLHIDEHHTIEDTALALGEAFRKSLASKVGIERYGYSLPMDECLAQVAIDFGGRPWLVWDATFTREKVGDVPTEMFKHFFKSFSDTSLSNLNIKVEGENEHHKIESIFKAWAKAIKMAVKRNKEHLVLPSTKGVL